MSYPWDILIGKSFSAMKLAILSSFLAAYLSLGPGTESMLLFVVSSVADIVIASLWVFES